MECSGLFVNLFVYLRGLPEGVAGVLLGRLGVYGHHVPGNTAHTCARIKGTVSRDLRTHSLGLKEQSQEICAHMLSD